MITEKEYILLIGLKTSPLIDETQYYYEIKTFLKDKFISYNIIEETPTSKIYNGYILTPIGERAIKEYEDYLQSIERDKASVKLAHEANDIAKEANNISTKAKNWSAWAVGISILSFVAAVVSIIVNIVTKCP